MYEVSIQGKCLLFISDLMQVDLAKPVNLVQIRSKDDLLQFLDSLAHTKGLTQDRFYLVCEDERQSWLDFVALYHWIEAAGGLVSNVQHQFLLIHRLGFWDLPKGKIEAGEQPREAAIREVTEECGIHDLKIVGELPSTYHTYTQHGKHMLKMTHWYRMEYAGKEKLVPQTEEGISDIRWMDFASATKALENSYPAIRKVFEAV